MRSTWPWVSPTCYSNGYLNGVAWDLAGEFTEIESGKNNSRHELSRALEVCREQKTRLVIAKLDRLSRNLAFIAALMESGVEFVEVDNPHANKLTVHILAAVAQHEREMISERTRAALQAAKAHGKVLGNPRLTEAARVGTNSVKAAAIPGYQEWRKRLISMGITHVWGVHVRAVESELSEVVRIDASKLVEQCTTIASLWSA